MSQHNLQIGFKLGEMLQRRRARIIDTLIRAGVDGRTEASLQAEFVWHADSMRAMLNDLLNRGDVAVHPDDVDTPLPRYVAVAFVTHCGYGG